MQLQLVQHIVDTSVRAARTEDGRPSRRRGRSCDIQLLSADGGADHIGAVLALNGEDLLADSLDPPGSYLFLDHRIQFLYNIELLHFGSKLFDHLPGQRIHHAKLQHRGVGQGLLYILIGDPAGDDSDLCIVHLNGIDRQGIGRLLKLQVPLLDLHMAELGVAWHHNRLLDILYIRFVLRTFPLSQFHQPLRMSQSCGGTEYKGPVKLLAQFKSQLHIFPGLTAVGRLQHRQLRRSCHHPGILFILGAVKPRIVGNHDHQTAVDSHIRNRVGRICRHVKAHMLHTGHGPHTRHRSSNGNLCGYFLIGRPLTVQIVPVLYQALTDLCAGRPRICGGHLYSRLISASGNSLIAKHNHLFPHFIIHPFVNLLLASPCPQTAAANRAPPV